MLGNALSISLFKEHMEAGYNLRLWNVVASLEPDEVFFLKEAQGRTLEETDPELALVDSLKAKGLLNVHLDGQGRATVTLRGMASTVLSVLF